MAVSSLRGYAAVLAAAVMWGGSGVAGKQSHPKLAEFLRKHGGLHASELGNER